MQVMRCLMITLDTDGWALLVILSLGPTLFGYLLFKVSPVPVRPNRQSISYSRTGHDSPARLLFSWAAS